MNKFYNRVKVNTSTTGTVTMNLGAAVAGFLTFSQAGATSTDVVTYVIEDGTDFEVGTGTYTSAGPTLTRDTVYRSTGAANIGKIVLSGSATVAVTEAREDFRFTIGSVLFAGSDGFIGQDNSNLYFDDTNNRLGIANGLNNLPQSTLQVGSTAATFRVSNAYTDASNGTWFEASWSSNVLNLGTNFNGTGVTRAISIRAGGVEAINISTASLVKVSTNLSINVAATANSLLLIGGTHTTAGNNLVNLNAILASSSTSIQWGIFSGPTFNPSGGSLATIYGIYSSPAMSGSSSVNITNLIGFAAALGTDSGYSGTVANGYGFYATNPAIVGSIPFTNHTAFYAPGITNADGVTSGTFFNYGFRSASISASAASGGEITNYNFKAILSSGSGAGVTTNYGYHLSGNGGTGGGGTTTNWAIYSTSTADSFILGNLATQSRLSVQNITGGSCGVQYLTELLTIAAAATTDTAIQIPAKALVIGVGVRVTTTIPTATTFDYGVSGATTRYGTGISTASTTTYQGTDDAVRYYSAATSIRITPNLTPGNTNGRLRVTIYYINIVPSTS